jgi:hypothetical protein
MKTKILNLLKGMNSDSKSESYKCEKNLCKILTDVCNKLEYIEDMTKWYMEDYPDIIDEIDIDNTYPGIKKLPEIIYCNCGTFEFKTSWLDIDLKSYFEELKEKSVTYNHNIIENVEATLNKHKEELEALKNLTYEDLDSKSREE